MKSFALFYESLCCTVVYLNTSFNETCISDPTFSTRKTMHCGKKISALGILTLCHIQKLSNPCKIQKQHTDSKTCSNLCRPQFCNHTAGTHERSCPTCHRFYCRYIRNHFNESSQRIYFWIRRI